MAILLLITSFRSQLASAALKEYLESREKEVIDIMMALFDQEKAMEQFMKQFAYEKKQEGLAEGKRQTALNMKKKELF